MGTNKYDNDNACLLPGMILVGQRPIHTSIIDSNVGHITLQI